MRGEHDDAPARRAGARRVACGALAAALAGLALAAAAPRNLGLFHDDGLYVGVARSLAGGAYRIPSVPGEPFETKYPPAYPLLLSAVWRLAPSFPSNIVWLKAVNAACVALAVLGLARLAAAVLGPGSHGDAAVSAVLLGTSPGLALFAVNQATSDALFAALFVWILALVAPGGRSREPLVAALVVAAILTRSVGVAIGVALTLERAWRRRWRAAALHAAATAAAFGGWTVWALRHRATGASPLVGYYQGYETTAVGYLAGDPLLAWRIVEGNVRMIARAGAVVSPAMALSRVALAVLAALGAYALARRGRAGVGAIAVIVATYLAAVAVYPFTPARYLLPVAPVFLLCAVAAARVTARRWLRVAASTGVAVALLVPNAVWISSALAVERRGAVRGWFGGDAMGYGWGGFEEAFAWVRANTRPDARLATIYDPMYFLYTGRQGIRPWFHRPETYFYPLDAPRPFVGTAAEVLRSLRDLQVDYLVIDPAVGYSEGDAVVALLEELIAAPEASAALVFTTSDGRHRIYRLGGVGRVRRRTAAPGAAGRGVTARARPAHRAWPPPPRPG